MNETDDRLVGDPVWELFPDPSTDHEVRIFRRYLSWLGVAIFIVVAWFLYPPLSVIVTCLAVAARDLQTGRRLARSIPDKAGGGICALFSYAWGAWRFGITAFVLIFVTIIIKMPSGKGSQPPPEFMTAALLWFGGFIASAALTAAGLVKAFRSGMRVWIGEGINQARTLLLGMLMVGFTFFVLGPTLFWIGGLAPRAGDGQKSLLPMMFGLFGCMFAGPVIILVVLDWFSRRVVADSPGKFGAKVPTVGKWDS
jgi:hypothetical protein